MFYYYYSYSFTCWERSNEDHTVAICLHIPFSFKFLEGKCWLCVPQTASALWTILKYILTEQIGELRNTLKGKLAFTWLFCGMNLNVACLSAVNRNFISGKANSFGLCCSCSRCTGSYGEGHEERQDYSQWSAVGLCSDRFARGSGLPEGNGSGWELCLGQPVFHDLLNPSGTVDVALLFQVIHDDKCFKT